MRFENSTRVRTSASPEDVRGAIIERFRKVASSARLEGDGICVRGIEQSFGSINRADTTRISLRQSPDGYLIASETHYRPSFWFWVLLLVLLFTWVLWLLPIVFYLTQKASVRKAVESCLERVKNEFDGDVVRPSSLADLEALGRLKEQGVLTEDEFALKKAQILGTRA